MSGQVLVLVVRLCAFWLNVLTVMSSRLDGHALRIGLAWIGWAGDAVEVRQLKFGKFTNQTIWKRWEVMAGTSVDLLSLLFFSSESWLR